MFPGGIIGPFNQRIFNKSILTSAPRRLIRYGAMEIKSTPCDSCPPWWGDQRDSDYKTWQLGVTFGDLGLRHSARGGEQRDEHQPAQCSYSGRSCPRGKPCKSCAMQSQAGILHASGLAFLSPARPQLCWRFSRGQGESSTRRAASFSSAAGPSGCHLEIPFLPLQCQGTACLHLASALPSVALPLAKFLPAVPSERHNSLFTYLFLLPVYELSKEHFILRKISFPLALWMLFAQQKPLRDTDSGPSRF